MSWGFRGKAAEPGDIRTGFQRERVWAEPRRAGRKSVSRRNSSRSSSSPGRTPRCPWGPGPGAGGRGARLGAKPQTRMRAQCTPRLLKDFGVPFASIFV